MPALHEMQQEMSSIVADMRSIQDAIGDKEISESQQEKWDELSKRSASLKTSISREQALQEEEQRMVQNTKYTASPDKPIDQDEQYRGAFDSYLRGGFSALDSEERSLLHERRAQGVDDQSKGGFTVPTEMLNKITEKMKAFGGIESISQVIKSEDGRDIPWPASDGTTEEGELLEENEQASDEDVEFYENRLSAYTASSKMIRVSNQLLQDAMFDMGAFLSGRIASRIGRTRAKYVAVGKGDRQPKGLIGSVTKTQNAGVSPESIIHLYHSVDPAYRSSPHFHFAFNDNLLEQTSQFKDKEGRLLWSGGMANSVPDRLWGKPYQIDNNIPDGCIVVGDFWKFIVRDVQTLHMRRLEERYAEKNQTGFIGFARFDCTLEDTSAFAMIKPKAK